MKLIRFGDGCPGDGFIDIDQGDFRRPAVDHRDGARFLISDFGQGSSQRSTFHAVVDVRDALSALGVMRHHGNAEAGQLLADLELGRQVRELVGKRG